MMIEVLKSKLHCVRVTEANLNYMGSITIDEVEKFLLWIITTVRDLKLILLRASAVRDVFA